MTGRSRVGSDPAAQLQAIDARQHQIEHYQARRALLEQVAGLQAIARLEGLVALPLEIADDDLANGRLIIDDEDGGAHIHSETRSRLR